MPTADAMTVAVIVIAFAVFAAVLAYVDMIAGTREKAGR